MFERYTEKARRAIFFARYEASQFGSPYIETEHLLLGLVREDQVLAMRFLKASDSAEAIRKQIEDHTLIREKSATSVDLPLSNECKRVLAYAAEEAERLADRHIGTEHLLLGMLREEEGFAAVLLAQRGLQLEEARRSIKLGPAPAHGFVAGAVAGSIGIGLAIELLVNGEVAAKLAVQTYAIPRPGDVMVIGKVSYRVGEVRFVYAEGATRVEKIEIVAVVEG